MGKGTCLILILTGAVLVAVACSDGGGTTPESTATTSGAGGSAGSGGAGGAGTHPFCDGLGLPTTPFDTSAGEAVFGGLASDFTVDTLAGTWTLSENWTGCDNYIFIQHFTNASSQLGDELWNSNLAQVIQASPPNVHYFFSGYADGAAKVQELKGKFDEALNALGPEVQSAWGSRLHYVTTAPKDIGGSVGALFQAQFPSVVFALGIDRHQRFDAGGSLARFSGGAFIGDLLMSTYLPRFYDFRYQRDAAVAAEADVTVVPVVNDVMVTENNQPYEVVLPDATTMAGFDTLEFDVQLSCGPGPTDCGEWDYEAYIELCESPSCEVRHQVALWITPYSRPGNRRWIIDGTPFLGFLREGGTRTFRFGMLWNMNPNQTKVSLRLSSRGGLRSTAVTPLYTGGDFTASYNDDYTPITFNVPPTAAKVELVAIISGHGQEAPFNCAEWCNHAHTFSVNENKTFEKSFPNEAGQALGCAERVDEGVVPGQYGNWAPSRAAWCPGLEVQPWRVDITDAITVGADNTISYAGSFNGGAPQGGRIRMSSFIAIYE